MVKFMNTTQPLLTTNRQTGFIEKNLDKTSLSRLTPSNTYTRSKVSLPKNYIGVAMANTPRPVFNLQGITPQNVTSTHTGPDRLSVFNLLAPPVLVKNRPNPPIHPAAEAVRRINNVHKITTAANSNIREVKRLYAKIARYDNILDQSFDNPKMYNKIVKKRNKLVDELAGYKDIVSSRKIASDIWDAISKPSYVILEPDDDPKIEL